MRRDGREPVPYFNEEQWGELIQFPDWYVRMNHDLQGLEDRAERNPKEAKAIRDAVYGFFERALAIGEVSLAPNGINRDEERQPIDMAVIHHTGLDPHVGWARLSAMHLLRIYVPVYLQTPELFGQPIWSNHVRKNRPVFYGYHWLVRSDGYREQLLSDERIGWHAGNWPVNCRSLGICFDGDFTHGAPTLAAMSGVADLLRNHYPGIPIDRDHIVGHGEVKRNGKTICPGRTFLGPKGWKNDLFGLFPNG